MKIKNETNKKIVLKLSKLIYENLDTIEELENELDEKGDKIFELEETVKEQYKELIFKDLINRKLKKKLDN